MLKGWDEIHITSAFILFWIVLLNINTFNAQLVVHENKQASTAHIWTLHLSWGGGTFPVIVLLWSWMAGFSLNFRFIPTAIRSELAFCARQRKKLKTNVVPLISPSQRHWWTSLCPVWQTSWVEETDGSFLCPLLFDRDISDNPCRQISQQTLQRRKHK